MTTGAILFAQNNQSIDYTRMAIFAADRIQEYLEIPVSLITDDRTYLLEKFPNHKFDNIIDIPLTGIAQHRKFFDGSLTSKTATWKNLSRSSVYDLTPYDTTIVLDSDYIINSKVLKPALELEHDFQIYKHSFDLAGYRSSSAFVRINDYSIPFYWATVFIFKKNVTMESFFILLDHIKENWIYFRTLYTVDSPTFRNDIAFSIAIHIMNGKSNGEFAIELPGKMTFISDKDYLITTDGSTMKFLIEKENYFGEYTAVNTKGIDVHVMNKYSLSRYIDGGMGV
jgi:hypothetical protein